MQYSIKYCVEMSENTDPLPEEKRLLTQKIYIEQSFQVFAPYENLSLVMYKRNN